MSESAATGSAPPATPSLGAFAVGPRVIDAGHRLGTTTLVAVVGRPETPHAGRTGFAYRYEETSGDDAALAATEERLQRIAALTHDALVPVIESGLTGRAAYIVEASVGGDRLSDRLATAGRMRLWQVAASLRQIGSALHFAHQCGVSHGAISPMSIWIDSLNRLRIGGFHAEERSPSEDQAQLAALAYELIAARPWRDAARDSSDEPRLVERLRGRVNGLSERVAIVIARGMERRSDTQYPTIDAFADAFGESVVLSAQEIAAGAWEAVSRQDLGMAAILSRMLSDYDPNSPEIMLLHHRLRGASVADAMAPKGAPPLPERRANVDASGAAELAVPGANGAMFTDAEMQRLFGGGEIDQTVTRGNPWVIFLAALFGMVLVMTVLAALAFNQR